MKAQIDMLIQAAHKTEANKHKKLIRYKKKNMISGQEAQLPGGKSRFSSIESQSKNKIKNKKTFGLVPSLVATNKKQENYDIAKITYDPLKPADDAEQELDSSSSEGEETPEEEQEPIAIKVEKTPEPPEKHDLSGVVDFLMKLDLKKQINIVKLIDLPNFELTDEEDEVNPTTPQLLKVMKIIFYQIAMIEERQRWRSEDFFKEYESKDAKNQKIFNSKITKVENLHSQMKFDFEEMKE